MHLKHSEINVLSNDDDVVPRTPLPTLVTATSLQTPHTNTTHQPCYKGQVN